MKKMLKNDLVDVLVSGVEVDDVYFKNKYGAGSGVAYDMIVNVRLCGGVSYELKAHAMRQSWALVGHLRPNSNSNEYKGSNKRTYRPNIRAYWLSPVKGALKEYFKRFTKKELQEIIIWNDAALNRLI